MVVSTYNSDLGDAWEYMDLPCYPAKYSGQAYRIGLELHDLRDDALRASRVRRNHHVNAVPRGALGDQVAKADGNVAGKVAH